MYYFASVNEETDGPDWITFLTEEEAKSDKYPYFKKWAHPLTELKSYIAKHPLCKIYKSEIEETLSEEAYRKYVEGLPFWINDSLPPSEPKG